MLDSPNKKTGIRIRSASPDDNLTAGADRTVLRNLTIWCNKGSDVPPGLLTSHGVHATVPIYAENVWIENFDGDGFHVAGFPEEGNADGTVLRNCRAGVCGNHGFHFDCGTGGDAQACVIDGCSADGNIHAGFYDATFGNTYLGCHSAYNKGPNYITDLKVESNASVFINCWSETGEKPNVFHGAPTIISGKIGGDPTYMTDDRSPFILEHGRASRAPLVYKNYRGKKPFRISLGDGTQTIQGPGTNMIALNWATLDPAGNAEDSTLLRYLDAASPESLAAIPPRIR